jgi:hypothetical protein
LFFFLSIVDWLEKAGEGIILLSQLKILNSKIHAHKKPITLKQEKGKGKKEYHKSSLIVQGDWFY